MTTNDRTQQIAEDTTSIPERDRLVADINGLAEGLGFYSLYQPEAALENITVLEAKLALLRRELQRGEA